MTTSIPLYLAFGAGVVSFLSPCILPLIPGYICYLAGVSTTNGLVSVDRGLVIRRAVLFNLGFMMVFIMMGAAGSYLGSLFLEHKRLLTQVGGVIIFLMGLLMAGVLRFSFFQRTYKYSGRFNVASPLGALLLGITFAAGWTPCVGPVLGSILIYAGMSGTVTSGAVLLSAYSLGLAVPFMLVAVSINWSLQYLPKFNRYLPLVSVLSGVILMIIGVLLFLDIFPRISAYLS